MINQEKQKSKRTLLYISPGRTDTLLPSVLRNVNMKGSQRPPSLSLRRDTPTRGVSPVMFNIKTKRPFSAQGAELLKG